MRQVAAQLHSGNGDSKQPPQTAPRSQLTFRTAIFSSLLTVQQLLVPAIDFTSESGHFLH